MVTAEGMTHGAGSFCSLCGVAHREELEACAWNQLGTEEADGQVKHVSRRPSAERMATKPVTHESEDGAAKALYDRVCSTRSELQVSILTASASTFLQS